MKHYNASDWKHKQGSLEKLSFTCESNRGLVDKWSSNRRKTKTNNQVWKCRLTNFGTNSDLQLQSDSFPGTESIKLISVTNISDF
jgi:hypothetical protein